MRSETSVKTGKGLLCFLFFVLFCLSAGPLLCDVAICGGCFFFFH